MDDGTPIRQSLASHFTACSALLGQFITGFGLVVVFSTIKVDTDSQVRSNNKTNSQPASQSSSLKSERFYYWHKGAIDNNKLQLLLIQTIG